MSQSYERILFEQDEHHVATITINRPEAMNSFDVTMMAEFRDVWNRIRLDDGIHCVVLRAAPGRAFCTGVDVKAGSVNDTTNPWSQIDVGDSLGPKSNQCWKPIVAAVHGLCAGGAFYWLNEADVTICSTNAQFFDPHVTYGMVAALEPIGLARKIALGEVLRMSLMGNDERITAATALRIGIVTEVVELDELWGRAGQLARSIAAKPTAATQGTIRAIWESLDMGRAAALQMGLKYCQLGNPAGMAEVDRAALMSTSKKYTLR